MKIVYPVVYYGENDDFAIEFPDLPGCTSGGFSMEETTEWGKDAACGWIIGEVKRGKPFNLPSPIEDIHPVFEDDETAEIALVELDFDAYNAKYPEEHSERFFPALRNMFARQISA